jgi:hypothetical protein
VRFHTVGLGATLSTQSGGQIFGFDIDQNGNDGVLASAKSVGSGFAAIVDIETFDQNTGAITKAIDRYRGTRKEFNVDAIFAGDVALVTRYVQEKGTIYYRRVYDVMNPVTGEQLTGKWTPRVNDLNLVGVAENQSTSTAVIMGYGPGKASLPQPVVIATNVASNTSKVFRLDPNLYGQADEPQIGQFTAANQAVLALTPDAGEPAGQPPINVLLDLTTGKQQRFEGLNEGPYGSGGVEGLAVDPNTGIAATTTELNAQVEFYDFTKNTATAVQLPCTSDTDEEASGTGIANDPVNHLFLVTEYQYCDGSQGSAIIVYDETGALVETITGFPFGIGEPAPVINPSKRMGWALGGDGFTQLRQFFY